MSISCLLTYFLFRHAQKHLQLAPWNELRAEERQDSIRMWPLKLLFYDTVQTKNRSFQVVLETHYNERHPIINLVPEEIGRVLLNLFNNPFKQ